MRTLTAKQKKARRQIIEWQIRSLIEKNGLVTMWQIERMTPSDATEHERHLAVRRLMGRGIVYSKYGPGGMYGPKLYGIAHFSHWKVK